MVVSEVEPISESVPPADEGLSGSLFVGTGKTWRKRRLENASPVSSLNGLPSGESADVSQVALAGLPAPLREVLSSRGVSEEADLADWFKPTLKSLRDPLSLLDLDKAVKRLVKARATQEHIVLYADYDLDGTSGLALALDAFRLMGFANVHAYQPQRLTEGYGLHSEAITRLKAEKGITLLVSIDLGITAMDEVETANRLGIDVIITDHHLPKTDANGSVVLPKALAVVNPNRGDCPSNLGHLCGTGVIFYLVLALRRALLEDGTLSNPFDPKALLDCFAIGTITDLVPLLHENRILVKHGLNRLAETDRPGLRELLKSLELWGRPLTAQDVAIRFAPKLNALSRMGSGIQPIDLYVETDAGKARDVVSAVLSNNQDRQASQKAADEEADRILQERPPRGIVAIASEKFHRGVVGLVATKLSQRYGVPAFVGSIEGESGSIIGSARMPTGMSANLLEAMGFATNYLDQFGGHAMAAGFEAKRSTFDLFRASLETWAETLRTQSEIGSHVVEYDAMCRLADLNSTFMAWHEHMGPFGAHAPIPMFLISDCLVAQVKVLKGGHLRLKLAQAGAPAMQAIWFGPPSDFPISQGNRVDLIGEVQWNHYQGSRSIQLLVSDVKIAGTAKA